MSKITTGKNTFVAKVVSSDQTTFVKKITIGTPISTAIDQLSIDALTDFQVTNSLAGQILVFDGSEGVSGKYRNTTLTVGTNGLIKTHNTGADTLNIKLDSNADVNLKSLTLAGNLLPAADSTHDLGSSSKKWKDLYLSGSTIHLGGLELRDSGTQFSVSDSVGTPVNLNLSGSKSQIRGMFSGGGDLSYNSGTGQFSFDVEQVYTKANFDSDLGLSNTGQLPEGTNLYYTDARVDSNINNTGAALVDNAQITFGNDSDLKILHDGSNSIIRDAGTGSLILASNNVNLKNATQTETLASFLSGGAVTLNHNNKTKLVTTDSGATVTGSLRTDSATVSGDLDVGGSFTTITTSGLTEGTNLYYTDARADSAAKAALFAVDAGGDGSFTYDSSSGRMVYTGPSASEVRAHLSATDAGGDGSFSYNSSSGVFTYTGPSASEVRAHLAGNKGINYNSSTGVIDVDSANIKGMFSASGDLSYNSGTGQFSFDVEQVYTKANFDSDLGLANTGQLPEGNNLYYTVARADSAAKAALFAVDAGGDGSFTYDSASGRMVYTGPSASETRAHFSGGTGITYNSGTGAISTTDGDIVHDNLSGFVADEHVAHSGVSIIAGNGLLGGGTIASSRTLSVDSGNVRGMFSATDAGGDGSFSYNSANGVFTYTGPSASEVRAHISASNSLSFSGGDVRAPQPLDSAATPTFAQIRGPSELVIDPAAIGNATGTVKILGNLQVEGTQTTINSSAIVLKDKNIVIADSAADSSALSGAGLTWGDSAIVNNPTFTYSHSNARFEANRSIGADIVGNTTGVHTGNVLGVDYIQRPHSTSTINYSVVVASKDATHRYNGQGSGLGYKVDGVFSPFLELTPGRTYRFTMSSSDMSAHPLRIYLSADKSAGEYTTNVTSTSTYTEITVTDATPSVLHYMCSLHGFMGNAIFTNTRNLSNFTTDNLTEGSSNLYHTNTRAINAVTGSNLDMGSNNITTTGKILFANLYSAEGDLPSASTYHGMFAHVHGTGKAYYSHAGNWIKLANNSEIPATLNLGTDFVDSAEARKVISVTDAGGDGSLAYNNSTGVLTYTGPSASEVRAHFSAGTGIDISSGSISGEDASTSNKGIAQFSSDHFSVSSGAVSLKADGIDDTHIDFGTGTNQVNTDDIPEGTTNKYYTTARSDSDFDVRLAVKTTDNLSEGSTNKYFSNELIDDRVNALLIGGTNITVTYDDAANTLRIDGVTGASGFDLSANDTDDISEGTSNLYFTNARADARVAAALATDVTINGNLTVDSALTADSATFDQLTADSATFNQYLSLPDNARLNIGTGPANNRTGGDLQIYHNGSKSIIDEDGTGGLDLKTNRLFIKSANDEIYADFRKDQYVRLYFDNVKRLETTSTGVTVVGTINADSATIAGDVSAGTFTGDGSNLTNLPASGDGGIAMAIALG